MKTLLAGSKATDYNVNFPSTWRTESCEWAAGRKFTQAEVDDIEARLAEFRRKRDSFRVGVFTVVQTAESEVAA